MNVPLMKPARSIDANDRVVLQVDDNESDVLLLERAFAQAGITNPLRVANCGQMAIDYLAGTGAFADRQKAPLPCMVLLDINMPGMSGFDVLGWIRRQPALKDLVVVLFSSTAEPEFVKRGYELGANDFVQKPDGFCQSVEIARRLQQRWLLRDHAVIPGTQPPMRVSCSGSTAALGEGASRQSGCG
jgi:CheY-like chemotaxis protein